MPIYRHRGFQVIAALFLVSFSLLFSTRLQLFEGGGADNRPLDPGETANLADRNTWLSIYQNGRRIGYAHKTFSAGETGFVIEETVFMRVSTLGMVQDLRMQTKGDLDRSLGVSSFRFQVESGRFRLVLQGRIRESVLYLESERDGTVQQQQIPVQTPLYLTTALVDAVRARGLQPGSRYSLQVFDPMTLGQSAVDVTVVETETIRLEAGQFPSAKLLLNFKGADQFAWVAGSGEVVKEKGLLGIHLEKTTRRHALAAISAESGEDLARLASVKSDRIISHPAALNSLQLRIDGPSSSLTALHGGRQHYAEGVLTIRKESLEELPSQLDIDQLTRMETIFLQPSLYIQSDHEKFRALAAQIVAAEGAQDARIAASRLVDWVYRNIEKRPVISVPDALATLENRQGDCNEHAVLLAALARAAGIPARIETGLVYLEGRFYYHAWNLLYLGRWVTADASFGQLPADVTHIRLASGHQNQFELLGAFDRLRVEVIGSLNGHGTEADPTG
jgi:hypothetical protein